MKKILKNKYNNLKLSTSGFTLVELIAIIVILATVFLVSFPALLNTAKSEENKKYNDMVENLCLAGKSYIYANMDEFETLSTVNSQIDISVKELIDYGNIEKGIKNPRTDRSIENNILSYTVLSDYSLECKYTER